MGQDDGIDLTRGDWQIFPIAFAPFLLSLKQPAVDEDLNAFFAVSIERCVDEVLGAGDRTSSA